MEDDFAQFMQKQDGIYSKFENARDKVLSEGLNKHTFSSKGAYMIYLVHPMDISQKVEELSKDIRKIIPAMLYSAPNVHTTISDYDGPRLDFVPDDKILKDLSLSTKEVSRSLRHPIIVYDKLLANQEAVILRGNTTEKFLYIAEQINHSAKNKGIELRMPWGAHITTARVAERIEDKALVQEFAKYVDSFNEMYTSRPTHIGAGYGIFSDDGSEFILTKFDEYKLK